MSPEASLRTRRWFRRPYDHELGSPEGYPSGWIPLLASGASTVSYCVDAQAGPRAVPLYAYHHGSPEFPPRVQFDSLAAMIGLIVRFFDEGLVGHDRDDGRLPSLRGAPPSAEIDRFRYEVRQRLGRPTPQFAIQACIMMP